MNNFKEGYTAFMNTRSPSPALINDVVSAAGTKASTPSFAFRKYGALAACLVVIVAVVALWRINLSPTPLIPSSQPGAPADRPDDKINIIPSYMEAPMQKLYFDPDTTHEEAWTSQQMLDFLGRNPRPAAASIPADLTEYPSDTYFVILNNDGTMSYGNFLFSYEKEGGDPSAADARNLLVSVSKDKLSPTCLRYLADEQTTSTINGHELAIGQNTQPVFDENGDITAELTVYRAEFLFDGLGYRVTGTNLTQDEFIAVLRGIVG